MESKNCCELCKGALKAYPSSKKPSMQQCTVCGLVQLRLTRTEEVAWLNYYNVGQYYKECVLKGFASFDDRLAHDIELARIRMENITRFEQSGTLLDIGCGNGALLLLAKEYGFWPIGVDIDRWAVNEAQKRHPSSVSYTHLTLPTN